MLKRRKRWRNSCRKRLRWRKGGGGGRGGGGGGQTSPREGIEKGIRGMFRGYSRGIRGYVGVFAGIRVLCTRLHTFIPASPLMYT